MVCGSAHRSTPRPFGGTGIHETYPSPTPDLTIKSSDPRSLWISKRSRTSYLPGRHGSKDVSYPLHKVRRLGSLDNETYGPLYGSVPVSPGTTWCCICHRVRRLGPLTHETDGPLDVPIPRLSGDDVVLETCPSHLTDDQVDSPTRFTDH